MSTLVPLLNPSFQTAFAAGVRAGSPVAVIFRIPILYRIMRVPRPVQVLFLGVDNLTVINPVNQVSAQVPWAEFYGYYESS
jgi:hypothetical protein